MHFNSIKFLSQLDQFRNLYDSKGRAIGNNYRPVQKINGREISYRSENGRKLRTSNFR